VGVDHRRIQALALRLLRGETIEARDKYGRRWHADATSLSVVLPGSGQAGPVLDGADAYDVAVTLCWWGRIEDDLVCECEGCGAPLVCFICDTCAEHCVTDSDPDACWEAHEQWRRRLGDPTFGPGATVTHPIAGIEAAPKPRWRS